MEDQTNLSIKNLVEYYRKMGRDDIKMYYKGPFDEVILSKMISHVRTGFSASKAGKKLFAIFLELAQNISFYSFEKNVVQDLPDSGIGTNTRDYETLLSSNGPAHSIVTGLSIGSTVDNETDGQQSDLADGDGADEDGFIFPNSLNFRPGATILRPLNIINTTGVVAYLEAWIDWNGDGDFEDANEMILDLSDDSAGDFGLSIITVNVPNNAIQNQPIGVRFRLSHTNNMTPYGFIESGEVEDYLISIGCPLDQCLPTQINVTKGNLGSN